MRPSLRTLDKVIDPLIAVVGVIVLVLFTIDAMKDEWGIIIVGAVTLIASLAAPLWIAIRTLPRVPRLAGDLLFRQELATTPMPASTILRQRVLMPMFRSMAPVLTLFLFWAVLSVLASTDEPMVGVFVLLAFGVACVLPVIGTIGVCLSCLPVVFRPGQDSGSILTRVLLFGLGTVAWLGACLGIMILLFRISFEDSGGWIVSVIYLVGGAFIWTAIIRHSWRVACKRFYEFE